MAYKVRIDVGKGKNRSVSQSVPLSKKEDVARWVRTHPFGNSNTKIEVKNLNTGKVITGRKLKFYHPKTFKFK